MEKFEQTERTIAQAENVLLEHGKYVCANMDEDHMYHLEEHEKGSDNMIIKGHIKEHIRMQKEKAHQEIMNDSVETSMVY